MAQELKLVGFVGLGKMGWPMARNLHQASVELVVYDVDRGVTLRFVDEFGGRAASAPSDFADCDAVITMLPNDRLVREVALDWEGGIAAQLRPGSVLLDMSSSSPIGIQGIAESLDGTGVEVVDAPVSGGVARAESGELSLIVGGEDATVTKIQPLLDVLGARTFRTGALGSGDAVKALNNFMAAAAYTAAAEALQIGERFGIDPATLFEVVNASTGRSFVSEAVIAGNVVNGAYATGFQLALLAKDVGIAAGLAQSLEFEAPSLELVNRRWQEAAGSAAPGTDHSATHLQWWPADATA